MYYHEAHLLIEELMDATLDERRKKHMLDLQTAPLLIIDDWGKVLGDNAAVTAMLDRLLHHAHVIKTGPRRDGPGIMWPCATRLQRATQNTILNDFIWPVLGWSLRGGVAS